MTAKSRMAPVVAVAALMLLIACGGDNKPTPAASAAATVAPTTSALTTSALTTSALTTTAAPARATSPSASGIVTTSPSGPAPVPAPGASFSGEGMTPAQANELQQAVDAGHQPWRVSATMVATAFVQGRFGWSDADCALADPHTAEVTNRADGRIVVLQLRQPARDGQGGIWTVVSGVWIT